MTETKEQFDIDAVGVAKLKDDALDDVMEESVVRFSNPRLPQEAGKNKTNLAAVCCPGFSLD